MRDHLYMNVCAGACMHTSRSWLVQIEKGGKKMLYYIK